MRLEDRQIAYLQAMGIPVWLERVAAATPMRDAQPPEPGAAVETMDWPALRQAVSGCTHCSLSESRNCTVFGVGDVRTNLLIVGEAPGGEEDRQGEPFVGRAGQLLNAMLKAIGMDRGEVFITNILKCRPPGNRDPLAEEMACCEPYLLRQIALIEPKVILASGRIAAQTLLRSTKPIGRLRGELHQYADTGVPVVATYHPAYLLRTPSAKGKVWQDLKMLRRLVHG